MIGGFEVREIMDDDLYRRKYSKINLRKLVLILEKYKNDKISLDQGKTTGNKELDEIMRKMIIIHKSDAQSVAKKLRESLNFK